MYEPKVVIYLEDETHVMAKGVNMSERRKPRLYMKREGAKGTFINYLQRRVYESEWKRI